MGPAKNKIQDADMKALLTLQLKELATMKVPAGHLDYAVHLLWVSMLLKNISYTTYSDSINAIRLSWIRHDYYSEHI